MQYQFREPVKVAHKAAMGKIYNLAKCNAEETEHIINFASGHPDTEIFREDILKKYIEQIVRDKEKDFFQYGSHMGFAPLREVLTNFENRNGNRVRQNDDLMITYGATEGISLVCMAMLNLGDRVLVENPSYVNAIKAFQIYGAKVIGVPLCNDGVDLDILESEMKKGAKFFYTIPNFNNPTGITTSIEKRKKIYELACKYGVLILEDNTYGNLRYRGEKIFSIKDLDEEGIVIYVSSLSKYIAPAIRIGYMVANQEIINRCVTIKAVTTNGVTNILQYVVWKMFNEVDMEREISRISEIYAEKLKLMEHTIDEYFPNEVSRTSPDGGMYIWVTMPEWVDINTFCENCATRLHIPITPGTEFCVIEPSKCTSMRFNFVKENSEAIVCGIKKVGTFMNDFIKGKE